MKKGTIRMRLWRKNNKEYAMAQTRIYQKKNKEKIAIRTKIYRKKNKDWIAIKKKIYNKKNAEKISMQKRGYRRMNRKKIKAQKKKYYITNRNKILLRTNNYQKNNRKKRNEYIRKKTINDLGYKIRMILSRRIQLALNGISKSAKTEALLGCSIDYFLDYIESQFDDDMSWANYGLKGWHIHHIHPCETFDLTQSEEQKKCFHYSNQKPLWQELHLGAIAHSNTSFEGEE